MITSMIWSTPTYTEIFEVELRRAKHRIYGQEHRAEKKAYQQAHPEIYRANNQARVTRLYIHDPLKLLFHRVKNGAKARGLACDLDLDFFRTLDTPTCQICGTAWPIRIRRGKSWRSARSVDRVDPTRGYIRGNVQIICLDCNRLKSNGTVAQFRRLIAYIERAQEKR